MVATMLLLWGLAAGMVSPKAYHVTFTPPQNWQRMDVSKLPGIDGVDVLGAWEDPHSGVALIVVGSRMPHNYIASQFSFTVDMDLPDDGSVKAAERYLLDVDGRQAMQVVLWGPGDGHWVRTRAMSMVPAKMKTVTIRTFITNTCAPQGLGCDVLQVIGGAPERSEHPLREVYSRFLKTIRFTGRPRDRKPGSIPEPVMAAQEPSSSTSTATAVEKGEPRTVAQVQQHEGREQDGPSVAPTALLAVARQVVSEAVHEGNASAAVALLWRDGDTIRPYLVEVCPASTSGGRTMWKMSPVARGRTRFVVLLWTDGKPAYVVELGESVKLPATVQLKSDKKALHTPDGLRCEPCTDGVLAAIKRLLATRE